MRISDWSSDVCSSDLDADQSRLCRAIDSQIRHCMLTGVGCGIHDRSTALTQHYFQLILHAKPCAQEINAHRTRPVRKLQFADFRRAICNTRVVECAIKPPECLDGGAHHCLDLRFIDKDRKSTRQ